MESCSCGAQDRDHERHDLGAHSPAVPPMPMHLVDLFRHTFQQELSELKLAEPPSWIAEAFASDELHSSEAVQSLPEDCSPKPFTSSLSLVEHASPSPSRSVLYASSQSPLSFLRLKPDGVRPFRAVPSAVLSRPAVAGSCSRSGSSTVGSNF